MIPGKNTISHQYTPSCRCVFSFAGRRICRECIRTVGMDRSEVRFRFPNGLPENYFPSAPRMMCCARIIRGAYLFFRENLTLEGHSCREEGSCPMNLYVIWRNKRDKEKEFHAHI